MSKTGVYSSCNPHRIAVDVYFDEPSRTRQEFAEECDINNIMSRYEATGVISHINPREPMYMDLGDGVPDLRTAIDTVRAATASFMSLPAKVRSEFDNDPIKFVEFAKNPDNMDRLVDLGLAVRPSLPDPVKVEVVSTAPPPGDPKPAA